MNLEGQLTIAAIEVVKELFETEIQESQIQFQKIINKYMISFSNFNFF